MAEIRSGREIHGVEHIDCDVVVVGSGGGGAPAAYELASAGKDVVVLEAGPHVKSEEFTQRELDTIERIYVDKGAQGPADGSIGILQGECVGGSTVVNGEVCFRTPEFVLEEWRRHGAVGMSASDMAPVFEHVEKMINVTPNAGRFLEPGSVPAKGMRALGLEAKPISRNVKDCKGCSYCFFGCAYGCKQSMDQSYLPQAMSKGARVISDARVERIRFDARTATGVNARTPTGRIEVRSKAVVLACGAIATPLLLIDNGLGTPHTGANLAVHPVVFVTGWTDEEHAVEQSTMLAVYNDKYLEQDALLEAGIGSEAFHAASAPGFGRRHREMARDIRKMWGGGAVIRDAHGPGRVKRNRKGDKVIEYALDARSRRAARVGMKAFAEILFAAGARCVSLPTIEPFVLESADELGRIDDMKLGPTDLTLVSYHPQGTARMGTVTDQDGMVRGARGLYVMDTSVFPTPVGVNPQVSVMAVSTVLARRLAARV